MIILSSDAYMRLYASMLTGLANVMCWALRSRENVTTDWKLYSSNRFQIRIHIVFVIEMAFIYKTVFGCALFR